MKKRWYAYVFVCLAVILAGCAQMAAPTGGTKDDVAPEIIAARTDPPNGTVHFSEDHITILFNEYFNVKTQQIVITPTLGKKPTFKTKGKKLEIDFKEPLAPNTTYTINLSGAIADITENNAVENMQYVFSTGAFLDSLSLGGKVLNAFSKNGVGGTTVMLQPADKDSAIFRSKPAYFLKTDKDGSFRFFHLKQGKYNVYAINDMNADLLFSQYPEDIAFLDSAVNLNTNVEGLTLLQFKPIEQKIYIRSTASISRYEQVYRFNRLVPHLSARAINASDSSLRFYAAHTTDSVFYMSLYDTLRKDTLHFSISSGDSILDTLHYTAHLGRKITGKAGFKWQLPPEVYIRDSIFIGSNTGCIGNAAKIFITDTISGKPVSFKIHDSFKGCAIFPETPSERRPVKILCLPGAFTSPITQESNDTLRGNTSLLPREKTGNISLKIERLDSLGFMAPVCVVMLDNQRIEKVKVSKTEPVVKAQFLKPGNYSFFIFDDKDGDGEWSTGNFNTKTQPEPVIRYKQVVKVKANWDQDLTWKL